MNARIAARISLAAALSPLAACIASNVVAAEDRAVAEPVETLAFTPAGTIELDGLYESVDIRGDAALTLRRVYYFFLPDGTYTAAALTESDAAPVFQVLTGVWKSTSDGLVLDGQPPVACEIAGDHLRLSSAGGSVVLRRRNLQ